MKNNTANYIGLSFVAVCILGLHENAEADLLTFQGQYQSELEERSAVSNQAVYDQLKASGCDDVERAATSSCSGATFVVWNNVRELVHTANELTNSGPTLFSLDSNLEGLGFALRWTAGEELARISKYSSGLNAGDQTSDLWSRLGGFINGSYTYGDQEGSEREDAFDFDGAELNAGLDYRLDDHWVVGGLLGYISEEVDFDAEKSIVDGGVTMDGLSLSTFVLYQSDSWFYSASIGYQYSDFTTTRSIRYPSFNPNTTSTNTEARSSNDAHTLTTNMSAGYSFFVTDTITIEPSVSVNYQDVSIDEYREKDINNDGFDFVVSKQNIDSLETVASLKTQYTLTTQYGVFMPFVDLQYYSQHKSDQRFIEAAYVGAMETLTSDAYFLLPTNSVEVDYKIYSFGVAAVIRGAQQTTFGSAASGGIQVYLNFREIKDIGDYSQKILSGGLRYEF